MKAAAYIRVSTDDQLTDLQLTAIRKYCAYHNLECDVFEEKISGKSRNRPELKRLMGLVSSGKYSRLIVYKLDRFSRSVRDLVTLLSELESYSCSFVSISESIDFSTAVGRMQVQLLAVFAEFEAAMCSERTKAGLKAAKARGVRLGHPAMDLDMELVRRWKASGVSVEEIGSRVGLSRSQVYRRLAGHQ